MTSIAVDPSDEMGTTTDDEPTDDPGPDRGPGASPPDASDPAAGPPEASEWRTPDDLELAARLRLATARLARQLRQQSGSGLSLSLQSALAAIDVRGPLSLGELAAIEHIAPPTVTKFVARLEENGLVERRRDPDDRRVTLLSVTAEGRAQLDTSRRRRNAWLALRLAELAPEDVARLAAAIDVLEQLARPEGDR